MAKKKKPVKPAIDSRANDLITYKILIAFVAATVAVTILMTLSSKYQIASNFTAVNSGLLVAGIVTGLMALLGFILVIINRFIDKKPLKIIGIITLSVGAAAWVSCMAIYYFYINAITMLCFLYPAAAVIYLIYLIYQPEFFAQSVVTIVSAFGFYILSKLLSYTPISSVAYTVGTVMTFVVGGLIALMYASDRHNGKIIVGKKSFNFACFKSSHIFLYVTCSLTIVGIIVSMLAGAIAAYCFLFISLAYLFVLAVYYTVKLM